MEAGWFITGARDHRIVVHSPVPGGWSPTKVFTEHEGSVEGVSWKRDDRNIFLSGSCDRSVRLWDLRTANCAMVMENAHEGDVNVVAFRPAEELNQFLSGGDDGVVYVRDIRFFSEPLAKNSFHHKPVMVRSIAC